MREKNFGGSSTFPIFGGHLGWVQKVECYFKLKGKFDGERLPVAMVEMNGRAFLFSMVGTGQNFKRLAYGDSNSQICTSRMSRRRGQNIFYQELLLAI